MFLLCGGGFLAIFLPSFSHPSATHTGVTFWGTSLVSVFSLCNGGFQQITKMQLLEISYFVMLFLTV